MHNYCIYKNASHCSYSKTFLIFFFFLCKGNVVVSETKSNHIYSTFQISKCCLKCFLTKFRIN